MEIIEWLRNKPIFVDGQMVATIPMDDWNRLLAEINELSQQREALLRACKQAFENLSPKGNIKKDFSGHNAVATLSRVIAMAEGKQ